MERLLELFYGLEKKDIEKRGAELGGVLIAFWEVVSGWEGKFCDMDIWVVRYALEN